MKPNQAHRHHKKTIAKNLKPRIYSKHFVRDFILPIFPCSSPRSWRRSQKTSRAPDIVEKQLRAVVAAGLVVC